MQAEIMITAHLIMHEEFHGNSGGLAWFKSHRTDGRIRRSTPFQYFDVRRLFKSQRLVSDVGHLDHRSDGHAAQFDVAVVVHILLDFEFGRSSDFNIGFFISAAA